MNIFTRIVLSLSLIVFVAQPLKAASWTDHAKKAGRIACYSAGLYYSLDSIYHMKHIPGYIKYCVNDYRDSYSTESRRASLKKTADFFTNIIIEESIVLPLVLSYSLKGLHKEICPNFNPIAWVKNKFRKKSEVAA